MPVAFDSPNTPLLRVVAVTGSDGSGKSTLTSRLVSHLRQQRRVETVYLGQSSGRIAASIEATPIVGRVLHRYLTRKSDAVHASPQIAPGNVTALAIYLLSRWRTHKFRRMVSLCRRDVLVVADRYPQSSEPGFLFDGPQLAKTRGGNRWVRMLRAREQALYDAMATFSPLLLIRLNVDAGTAHARKPDHSLDTLRRKTDLWPTLRFNAVQVLELDARQPADVVLSESLAAVRSALEGITA